MDSIFVVADSVFEARADVTVSALVDIIGAIARVDTALVVLATRSVVGICEPSVDAPKLFGAGALEAAAMRDLSIASSREQSVKNVPFFFKRSRARVPVQR